MDDLICGDRDGFVYYFKRNEDGTLAAGEKIKSAGSEIDILYNSAPEVADLNGDGLLDLLVGTQSTGNYLYIYYNTGTKTEPQFGSYNFLLNKGMFVSITNAAPELFDLDGDGVNDMISGNSMGEIWYYHNSGTNSATVYDDPVALDVDGSAMKVDKYSQFCFTDWNNDGVVDMVVGDKNEKVMLFLGKGGVALASTAPAEQQVLLVQENRKISFSLFEGRGNVGLFTPRGQQLENFSVQSGTVLQLPSSLGEGIYFLRGDLNGRALIKRVTLE